MSGDELNSGRTGKVVRVSGQNVDVSGTSTGHLGSLEWGHSDSLPACDGYVLCVQVMFSRVGIDVVVSFKKTELARAPEEVRRPRGMAARQAQTTQPSLLCGDVSRWCLS